MNFLTLPGVSETMFLKLVLKPSLIAPGIENGLAKEQQLCIFSPGLRWKLLSSLSDWRIILRIARPVYSLDCSSVYSGVCADPFLQMVYGLCWDDNGELLLQPVSWGFRYGLVFRVSFWVRVNVLGQSYNMKMSFSPGTGVYMKRRRVVVPLQ